MWKYILIGLGTVILEWIFLSAFSPWFNGMGELGGIIIGVGFFLAFEIPEVCRAAHVSLGGHFLNSYFFHGLLAHEFE